MEHKDYRLAAIMYTDIAGFSEKLASADPVAQNNLRFYNSVVTGMAQKCNGSVIKSARDIFLLDFKSTVYALSCAMDIQTAVYEYNKTKAIEPLLVRIGIHLGDICFNEADAPGDGVVIAKNLNSIAAPGSICFSEDVYNQVLDKLDFRAEKLDKLHIKSINKYVQPYLAASGFEEGLTGKPYGNNTSEPQQPGAPGTADIARDIGRAVEGIAKAIEDSVQEWRKYDKNRHYRYSHERKFSYEHPQEAFSRKAGRAAESFANKIGEHIEKAAQKSQRDLLKEELKRHEKELATGRWDKELRNSEHFKPGPEELLTDFSVYREAAKEKARKTSAGFAGNLISFVAINSLLWYVNINYTPGFLWAAIASAGWASGLVSSFFAMIRAKAKSKEAAKMPDLNDPAIAVYKKLNRVKDSMAMHFASTLSVPPLLFIINHLTTPGILWAAIPSAIMGFGFLGHLVKYPATVRKLEKKMFGLLGLDSWKQLFKIGKEKRQAPGIGPYAEYLAEAVSVRDDIVKSIKSGKTASDFGREMIPVLDKYVEQVKTLCQALGDTEQLVNAIPLAELKRDRDSLAAKMDAAESKMLKDEYTRSIEEIDRQLKASKGLAEQKEILKLRLASSVNALKQLKLDLARLKALPETGDIPVMEEIRQKAKELNIYMDDIKNAYFEVQADPYEELERKLGQKNGPMSDDR